MIRTRLTYLIQRMNEAVDEPVPSGGPVDDGTFNPEAVYDRLGQRQATANAITTTFHAASSLSSSTSAPNHPVEKIATRDDIDKLFEQSL